MVIHYICRGNAFRSIIAEAYTKSLGIPGLEIVSSGTVASDYREYNIPTFAKVQTLLAAHGLGNFTKDHYADDLTQALIDHSDIVVCLNKRVFDEASAHWQLPQQTYVWDITDMDEPGRMPENSTEYDSYMEDAFREIAEQVDSFVRNSSFAKRSE